jgi:hypothetical protein
MPLSTMPMMTFWPLDPLSQTPPSPLSPRKSGVVAVSSWRISSRDTASTPGIWASLSAWAWVSSAAKPLKA